MIYLELDSGCSSRRLWLKAGRALQTKIDKAKSHLKRDQKRIDLPCRLLKCIGGNRLLICGSILELLNLMNVMKLKIVLPVAYPGNWRRQSSIPESDRRAAP